MQELLCLRKHTPSFCLPVLGCNDKTPATGAHIPALSAFWGLMKPHRDHQAGLPSNCSLWTFSRCSLLTQAFVVFSTQQPDDCLQNCVVINEHTPTGSQHRAEQSGSGMYWEIPYSAPFVPRLLMCFP